MQRKLQQNTSFKILKTNDRGKIYEACDSFDYESAEFYSISQALWSYYYFICLKKNNLEALCKTHHT